MLVCNNQLTKAELKELDSLSALCQEADGGIPALYPNLLSQKRATDSNVLYWQEGKLVGFLSVYFFYYDACEVSLMVAPTHRRQGIAKRLVQTILPLVQSKQVDRLIFSTTAKANEEWLAKLGFHYKNSEYHMQRHSYEPILEAKQQLAIRKATEEDIPTLCIIDELSFNQQDNMNTRFDSLLNDKDYTLLLAIHKHKIVGKAHIHWQEEHATFSDIAILPVYQGQGLGGELLSYCINEALSFGKKKLALDVETSNCNALNLYVRHGFKIVTTNDFWAINIVSLRMLLQS